MALGVRGRELAAGITGTGHQAAPDGARFDAQAERIDGGDADADVAVGDIGDQQVLPHGEPERAAAEALGNLGEAAHLPGRQAAHRQHQAEIIEACLLLGIDADMAPLVGHRPRRHVGAGGAAQRCAVLLLDFGDESLAAHPVEHVFQARLQPVGAIAMGDEGAHHGARHCYAFLGLQQDAGFEGEIEMAGDAAQLQAEVDARLEPGAAGDLARHEADVVGVLEHRDATAAVEGDVELARQAVHLAVIEDVVVHGAAERPRVVDLLRVDAGGRAAGDVADIVGARAARGEAQRLHRQQHVDGVRRADLADLQVGAGRHIGIAAAEGVGGIGQAAHLPGAQDAVGDAQAAHEGVLRRSDIEEALILGQEDVDALGELPRLGAAHHLVPAIQRMARALGALLGDQLAARRHRAVLGCVLQRVGADGLGRRRSGRTACQLVGGLAGLDAADEALQPLLLLVVEFAHAAARVGTRCRA